MSKGLVPFDCIKRILRTHITANRVPNFYHAVCAQRGMDSQNTPPFVPTEIGEIAGEIKRSAWRSFLGLPNPAPEPQSPSLAQHLAFTGPLFGIVAIVLAFMSGLRQENWRFAAYGTGLGVAAVLFQFIWSIVLLIAGVALLIAIIESIGDIFSF